MTSLAPQKHLPRALISHASIWWDRHIRAFRCKSGEREGKETIAEEVYRSMGVRTFVAHRREYLELAGHRGR